MIPLQWDQGRGLPEEGAQGKGVCLSLGGARGA